MRELAVASAEYAVKRAYAEARTHYLLDWKALGEGPCDGYSSEDLAEIDEEVAGPAVAFVAKVKEELHFPFADPAQLDPSQTVAPQQSAEASQLAGVTQTEASASADVSKTADPHASSAADPAP